MGTTEKRIYLSKMGRSAHEREKILMKRSIGKKKGQITKAGSFPRDADKKRKKLSNWAEESLWPKAREGGNR